MLLSRLRAWLLARLQPDAVRSEASASTSAYIDSRDCGLKDAMLSGWYRENGELFKGFQITQDDVVLDVGCGPGGATMFAANIGAHVIFSDVLPEKIEALRARVATTPARQAQGLVSDSNPLPLEDGIATRVVAMEVLEHVQDPAQVLNELVRVGKPGALYLLAVPDARGEHMQKCIAPESYFEAPNHIRIIERDEFAGLVTGAGLIIEQQTTYGFFWTMWMLFHWSWAKSPAGLAQDPDKDLLHPPYPALLNDWARAWNGLIDMPESAPVKAALDDLLPKSQVIVARKPY
ncbi:class I SAM-dependent methyltransferase [Pseudomonas sp. TTU2014-080ASC]|uniref:class I SAM-dependent methyltransferase n=1 Tax=Pseudomonas sp. TTU2014-080ASC TaxID=1729724 RepID=UPI0009EA84BA|nr:class I SAM-dependent methyltransferase [Pseudomonas sp. TTU2014-080ASC]